MKIAQLSIEGEIGRINKQTDQPRFQRIDIEYIVALNNESEASINHRLVSGLQNNLEQANKRHTWEQQLESQIDHISARLITQNHTLFEQNTSKQPIEKTLVLSVLKADESHVSATVQSAIKKLHQVISDNKENYYVSFALAWLYLFYQNNYVEAEKYFEVAMQQAHHKDSHFFLFASRHLAKTHYLNGDAPAAEAIMIEVLNSSLHPDPEYQYEYARYLAAMGELKLSSLYLAQAIEKLPIYYMQATVEPDFQSKGIISQLLSTYKEQSLKYLREQYKETWRESNLDKLDLPEGLSTKQAFQASCKQHEEKINKHALVIVKNNREHIKQQLLKHSKETLLTELIHKEAEYIKAIGNKRDKWRWVNKSGGVLIHAASVLLLGTLFVLAAKFILVSLGLGTVFHFEEVTGRAFLGVIVLGFMGFYLLKSQPFGIRKLFQKSLRFRDAMTTVHRLL